MTVKYMSTLDVIAKNIYNEECLYASRNLHFEKNKNKEKYTCLLIHFHRFFFLKKHRVIF